MVWTKQSRRVFSQDRFFIKPIIIEEDQILLKNYFNYILEIFREKLDSEFLTTYKYSDAEYTRKYLGLTQVRALIETFPIINMNSDDKEIINELLFQNPYFMSW